MVVNVVERQESAYSGQSKAPFADSHPGGKTGFLRNVIDRLVL